MTGYAAHNERRETTQENCAEDAIDEAKRRKHRAASRCAPKRLREKVEASQLERLVIPRGERHAKGKKKTVREWSMRQPEARVVSSSRSASPFSTGGKGKRKVDCEMNATQTQDEDNVSKTSGTRQGENARETKTEQRQGQVARDREA